MPRLADSQISWYDLSRFPGLPLPVSFFSPERRSPQVFVPLSVGKTCLVMK
ncbi:hypothetical protein FXW07_18425 [Methanosarcina sp. DH1]|nr:hypothetical protein [Methanosarcina sp. DH1]